MIEGFRVHMSSTELKEYTAHRAAWHIKHATGYREEMAKLRQLAKEAEDDTKLVGKSSRDSVGDLEKEAARHERQGRYFKFISEHLAEGETFVLSHNDLQLLEIAPSHGY